MNGVHDLGGTDGLGPVPVEETEPVWHADWEKSAFTFLLASLRAGLLGVDMLRYGVERMHPAVYLLSPYYEHWLHAIEHYGVEKGVFDPQEIDRRTRHYLEHPDDPLPDRSDPELLAFLDAAVKHGASAKRESGKVARFAVGDRVTVLSDSPKGHTRKARYIRGRNGVIELVHGAFVYPDSAGNGGPDAPEHVYTVKFTSSELWGPETAEPNGVVYFDVWEPYLVPARTQEAAA